MNLTTRAIRSGAIGCATSLALLLGTACPADSVELPVPDSSSGTGSTGDGGTGGGVPFGPSEPHDGVRDA